jgi:multiple sugar transport system permease protein
MTTVWWVTGYYLVIYLAALQDIPRHLYEAAAIDGAGRWQAFWSITMPLLRPIFLFVIVVHIIGAFQIFGQVFVLTNGGPADSTRTVVQHIYETGFTQQFLLGPAAAMSWVLFILILVFSILQFRLLRGVNTSTALFSPRCRSSGLVQPYGPSPPRSRRPPT